jgi:uncharacterized protein (TIGR02646 family)
MIILHRSLEPELLVKKKAEWLDRFLQVRQTDTTARPPNSQYAHVKIKNALRVMSFHKCFYCERKLSEQEDEVEHYIEVAERPELAFDWFNLYLACKDCNKHKRPNTEVAVTDCLNPCDTAEQPQEHIAFDDEMIRSFNGSQKGFKTIQKYFLDRESLNLQRLRRLHKFKDVLLAIRKAQINEARRTLTAREKELLAHFQQPDQPFSLMFRIYLSDLHFDSLT